MPDQPGPAWQCSVARVGCTLVEAPPALLVEPLGHTCGDCLRYMAPSTCALGKHPKPDAMTPSCKRWAPRDPGVLLERIGKQELLATITETRHAMAVANSYSVGHVPGVPKMGRNARIYEANATAALATIGEFCVTFGVELQRIQAEAVRKVPSHWFPLDSGHVLAVGANAWLKHAGIIRAVRADTLGVTLEQCERLGCNSAVERAFASRPDFFHGVLPPKGYTNQRRDRIKAP